MLIIAFLTPFIAATGWTVRTIAGSRNAGLADGPSTYAMFNNPGGIALGPDGSIFVADKWNRRIRFITPNGTVFTLTGSGEKRLRARTGAQFVEPKYVAVDPRGNVYVADSRANRIRHIDAVSGSVTTIAGTVYRYGRTHQIGSVQFSSPSGIAVYDATKSVYIYVADSGNNRIGRISLSGDQITIVAGTGAPGFLDGNVKETQFNYPAGIAVDRAGDVYACDYKNHRIRRIAIDKAWVSTVAGNGEAGFRNGPTEMAKLFFPHDIAVDAAGVLYVAEPFGHRIRRVVPNGAVTTLAGSGRPGFLDGNAATAQFNRPMGIAVAQSGEVYVSDMFNMRIRRIDMIHTQDEDWCSNHNRGECDGPNKQRRDHFRQACPETCSL